MNSNDYSLLSESASCEPYVVQFHYDSVTRRIGSIQNALYLSKSNFELGSEPGVSDENIGENIEDIRNVISGLLRQEHLSVTQRDYLEIDLQFLDRIDSEGIH